VQLGLTLQDPIGALWQRVARQLSPELAAACDRIATAMTDELLLVTIGCLLQPSLMLSEITAVITDNGGKPGWVRTVQYLIGHQFPSMASSVPPSAALAMESGEQLEQSSQGGRRTARFRADGEEARAAFLFRTGQLCSVQIPRAKIPDVITQTDNPTTEPLSYLDTVRVMRVLFAWSAAQVHVEGDKQMSKHLAGQLYELLPHPYGNCTWMQKFETRKSNGRKSRAKVCSATPHHTMHPMHTPGSGGGRVAYTVCGICLSRSCMGLSRSPRSR
jgi:hypothetical protein